MERHSQPFSRPNTGRSISGRDVASAKDYFEYFLNASTLKHILGYYRSICDLLNLRPTLFPIFYAKLRNHLTSWRAKALWKKFDLRASHKCYGKGKLCSNSRVLIIGAGPCGLRTAIEAQLLGAKVVIIEKRDRLSRNNVLHLWPFVIEDLRALGAKKFFGKFCAGAIDHISIRQLQCILLKVCLLLGVEVHTEVSFERLIEPDPLEKNGWRAEFKPCDHPVSQYEFDIIIGADGKRNTLEGFKRKEFRGKLAIAITANFINKRTEAEARVQEISGVAFIFNQKFFKELHDATGIDLENIVYYKDDTHYFVMTAKKSSLIDKRVIKQDLADTARLLSPDNVDRDALMEYAKEAANFSTNRMMPDLEFAVNHYGQPDVAMFDFTSMYAAENASKVCERHGYRLLMILVGDSLLEPFWPTGSGCARGFLSSMDAAWAIRSWCSGCMTPLDVVAERESIYRLLAQTTPDNLNKDWKAYTLDPSTRYPNLNRHAVLPHQVVQLFDTDNPKSVERMRRNSVDLTLDIPAKKRRRGAVDTGVLVCWVADQVKQYEDITISDIKSVFHDGKVLCAIIHRYRPDLVDISSITASSETSARLNQLAIDILERDIGISPLMTGDEMTNTSDTLTMVAYLTQIYDHFRGEIPHIKHPKFELPKPSETETRKEIRFGKHWVTGGNQHQTYSNRHRRHGNEDLSAKCSSASEKRSRKRRSDSQQLVSTVATTPQHVLDELEINRMERLSRRRQQRKLQTEQFIKSMQMLQSNAKLDQQQQQPFEDYSLFVYRQTAPNFEDRVKDLEKQFVYTPDHERNRIFSQSNYRAPNQADEDLAARIKSLEEKWREPPAVGKKPRDLMRAIGKIETSDWNIKEIEKKIKENKLGRPSTGNKDKEKVPKWSKEQFIARQTKMEKQHLLDRQDSAELKFADIDKNIRNLDQRLKEGSIREPGHTKVALITEKLVLNNNGEQSTAKVHEKISEYCHFCRKRVYLAERLSAEGRFFHHSCFKCQYCNTQLRHGSYSFEKDDVYGPRFYCLHHYGMQGDIRNRTPLKALQNQHMMHQKQSSLVQSPPLPRLPTVRYGAGAPQQIVNTRITTSHADLVDRVRTPERVEFACNPAMSGTGAGGGNVSSDHEDPLSQMDEDEWTDKNFGASTAEMGSTNEEEENSSSVGSDSNEEDDDDDAYEEAIEEPATKEGTLKWAERVSKRYGTTDSKQPSDSDQSTSDASSYCENSSEDEESETATEGEDDIRARELRQREVRIEAPTFVVHDTESDTEMLSNEGSSNNSYSSTDDDDEGKEAEECSKQGRNQHHKGRHRRTKNRNNSATEISTDSEFAQDEKTPVCENQPSMLGMVSLGHVTEERRPPVSKVDVQKLQVTRSPFSASLKPVPIEAHLRKPLDTTLTSSTDYHPTVGSASSGYTLNRTHSTGGIAAKVSLELKKKYLQCAGVGTSPPSAILSASPHNTHIKSMLSVNGANLLQKSESVSTLDHKLKSLHTNITDCQNLLKSTLQTPTTSSANALTFVMDPPPSQRTETDTNQEMGADDNDLPMDSLMCTVNVKESLELLANVSHSASDSSKLPLKSISSEKKMLNQPKPVPLGESWNCHKTEHKASVDSNTTISIAPSNTASVSNDHMLEVLKSSNNEVPPSPSLSSKLKMQNHCDKAPKSHPRPLSLLEFKPTDERREHQQRQQPDETHPAIQLQGALQSDASKMEDNSTSSTSSSNSSSDTQNRVESPINNGAYVLLNSDIHTENINGSGGAGSSNISGGRRLDRFGGEVIDLKPSDLEEMRLKQQTYASEPLEQDSLLIFGDNTNSLPYTSDQQKQQRMEEKLAKIKAEQQTVASIEFDEHCKRLQSKSIEFGNAKDSIDVRRSRLRSVPGSSAQTPDLISQQCVGSVSPSMMASPPSYRSVESSMTPVAHLPPIGITKINSQPVPDVIYKKERIEFERNVNQRLIQELVMDKMRAENKFLERRNRRGSQEHKSASPSQAHTPDVVLTHTNEINGCTMPLHYASFAMGNTDKLKQDAKRRAQMLTNEELGLSPEDKLLRLRQKVMAQTSRDSPLRQRPPVLRPQSWMHPEASTPETFTAMPALTVYEQRKIERAKSYVNIGHNQVQLRSPNAPYKPYPKSHVWCKSDPNLVHSEDSKPTKDRDRRKSISKLFSTLFSGKSSPNNKTVVGNFLSRMSSRAKDLSPKDTSPVSEPSNQNVTSRAPVAEQRSPNACSSLVPPPVPPLPLNYSGIRATDESSEGDHEWKSNNENSSCDTLDQTDVLDSSIVSLNSRKSTSKKGTKKRTARHAQSKRHRMAQEIQRKLEETEVKTRELEERGVLIEKALRGEEDASIQTDSGFAKSETELLQEWFDLMRDRTELRRYERELMVRAQELELEDRHMRLQQELRERLENEEVKTQDDAAIESSIINEMLEIVAKRDSLNALLEDDRQRCSLRNCCENSGTKA